MPKITALSNIKHDGKDYAEGETLDVTKSEAEWLIHLGAAEAGGKTEKKPTATEAKAAAEAEAAAKAEAEAKELAEKEAADKAAADAVAANKTE